MALIGFVMLYMLATIAIGLYAATRVSSTSDFALAGRSLPLPMVITATFATWFGSETILGLPGRFIESGIVGVIEEPFGSGMALILVGMFFAQKLYKLNILTIGDYYRERYGRGVEVLCTLFIVLSYLGWVGAQVAALGLVINLITEGYISVSGGMVIGTVVVLAYTMYGGMWSVAVTDFVQMIIIVLGLVAILIFASDLAGGFGKVIDYAHERDLFNALPEPTATGWLILDILRHHDDDRLDSAAGRLPARHVRQKRADGRGRPRHRRLRLHPLCVCADVHRHRRHSGNARQRAGHARHRSAAPVADARS